MAGVRGAARATGLTGPMPKGRTSALAKPREKFRGTLDPFSVLGRSALIWLRNAPAFAVLSVLIHIPLLAYGAWILRDAKALQVGIDPFQAVYEWAGWALGLVAAGPMAYDVVKQLQGERAPFVACIRVGMARLVAVLGVWLLMLFNLLRVVLVAMLVSVPLLVPLSLLLSGDPRNNPLFVAAMVALFGVPVVRVYGRLWIAVPVAVVERLGPDASVRRSSDLSRGNLLRILIVAALVVGSGWLAQAGIHLFVARAPMGMPADDWATFRVEILARLGLGILVLGPIGAVASAVAYHDLRVAKEDVSIDEIAQVFD